MANELKDIAAVAFGPPRQGAEAQVREFAKSEVPVIVAVSCNAATFAHDLNNLVDADCCLGEVTLVNQFRYSVHVEIVARLTR
jgi:23S rRNA (uracil1939-C5)-methyltransferase